MQGRPGHPLQSCPLTSFLKDSLPCVCIVVLVVVGALLACPAKSMGGRLP